MSINQNSYQSYLLRMWKESANGEWRAVLLSIPTQERRHFSNLQSLFEFLGNQEDYTLSIHQNEPAMTSALPVE